MKLERFRLEIAVKRAYEVSNLKDSVESCRTAVIVQFLDFPEIIIYPLGQVSLSSNAHDKKDIQYGVFHKAEFVLEEGIGSSIFPTQCFCTLAEFMTTDKARTVGRWTTVCDFCISPPSVSGVFHESSALFDSFQTLAVRNRRGQHAGWVEMSSQVTQMVFPSPMMVSPSTERNEAKSGREQDEMHVVGTSRIIGPSVSFDSSSRTPEEYYSHTGASAFAIPNKGFVSNQNNGINDTETVSHAALPSLERKELPAQTNKKGNQIGGTDLPGTSKEKRSKTSGKTFRLVVKRKELSENLLPESSATAVVISTSTIKAPRASGPPVKKTSVHHPLGSSTSGGEVGLRQEGVLWRKDGAHTDKDGPPASSLPTEGSDTSAALLTSSPLNQSFTPIPISPPVPPAVSPSYPVLLVSQSSSPGFSSTSLASGSSNPPLSSSPAAFSPSFPHESKNILSILQCDILYQLHAICNTIATALKNEKNSVLCTKSLPQEPATTLVRFRRTIEALVSQLLRKMNILVQLVYHLVSQQRALAPIQQQTSHKVVSQTPASLYSDVSNPSHSTGVQFLLSDGTLGSSSLHTEALSPSQGSIGGFLLYDVLFQLEGGEGHVVRLLKKHGSTLEKIVPSLDPNVQTHCTGVEHLVDELMKKVNVLIQLALSDSSGHVSSTSKREGKQNENEETTRKIPSREKHLVDSSNSLSAVSVATSRVSLSLSSSPPSSLMTPSSRLTSLPMPSPREVYCSTTDSPVPSPHYSDRGLPSTLHLPSPSPSGIPSLEVASLSLAPASPPTTSVKGNPPSFSHSSPSQMGTDQSHASQSDTHRSSLQEAETDVKIHPTMSASSPPSVLAPSLSYSCSIPPAASSPSPRPLSNSLRNQLESFTFCSSLSAPSASTGEVKDESAAYLRHRPPSPTYSSDEDFTSSSSSTSRRNSSSHRYKRSCSGSSSSRSGSQRPLPASSRVEYPPSLYPLSTPHTPAPIYTSSATSSFNTPLISVPSAPVQNYPSFNSSEALTVTPPVPSIIAPAVPSPTSTYTFPTSEVSVKEPSRYPPYTTIHPVVPASGNSDVMLSTGLSGLALSPGPISVVPSAPSLLFSGGHNVPFLNPAKKSSVLQANPAEKYSEIGQSSTIVRKEEI